MKRHVSINRIGRRAEGEGRFYLICYYLSINVEAFPPLNLYQTKFSNPDKKEYLFLISLGVMVDYPLKD